MDPQTGTFLSVDPMVTDRWDPQSYNAYSYARNNPNSITDPTGMCWFWGAFGCFEHVGDGRYSYVPPWDSFSPPPPSGPAPSGGLGTLGIADVGSAGPSGIGALGGAPGTSQGPQGGGSTGGWMATAAVIAIAEPTPVGEAALATVAVGITAVTAGTAMVRGVQALMQENGGASVDNPSSLEGATPEEVEQAAKEAGYTNDVGPPRNDPGGKRLQKPGNPADQVRIQRGNPNDPNPVKQGPYVRVTQGGVVSPPIPLAGNSTLR